MTKAKKTTKQIDTFRNVATELGCDEDAKAFERAFKKIGPPERPVKQKQTKNNDPPERR